MIEYPVANLKYAADSVLPTVQNVIDRYDGRPDSKLPSGITHLADIVADTRRVADLTASGDPKTKILLDATFAKGDLFGIIARDDAHAIGIIAFRGTEEVREWIDDILFDHVAFDEIASGPQVHEGFHLIYTTVRESLMSRIPLLDGLERVIVAGHSLGGAVASLCVLDLAAKREANGDAARYEGCTFASPRVFWGGTEAFEEAVHNNLRVANPADIVTHLPANTQAYFHVQGGLEIRSRIVDFHSLTNTYLPGVQAIVQSTSGTTVQLLNAEHTLLREALARQGQTG